MSGDLKQGFLTVGESMMSSGKTKYEIMWNMMQLEPIM
jgi:hypothetical protein